MSHGSIAYLGPEASYSHQAALQLDNNASLSSQKTIRDVFQAVQDGKASTGIVPFENSSNGTVDVTLDCLTDRQDEFTAIKVQREIYLQVNHCVLGVLDPKDDSALFSMTAAVYSHPQALGQCQKFLTQNMAEGTLHETASTSEAAAIVSKKKSTEAIAIASRLAAATFGLDVLAENIQDAKDNGTRFLVLSKSLANIAPVPSPSAKPAVANAQRSYKSLLTFSVDHAQPGSLAKVLLAFQRHDLNLTSINSRPSRRRPWHYLFLVECACPASAQEAKASLNGLKEELDSLAERWRLLGTWVGHDVETAVS